jgi:hypothetical protein
MDFAFEPEIGCRGSERHAMLPGAGLCDELLLAHVFGEQPFSHAMVEFVRAGMVQILALQIDLGAAVFLGKSSGVVNRRGPSLEVLTDVAKLGNKSSVVLDLEIRIDDFRERFLELRRKVFAAVFSEKAFSIRDLCFCAALYHWFPALFLFWILPRSAKKVPAD